MPLLEKRASVQIQTPRQRGRMSEYTTFVVGRAMLLVCFVFWAHAERLPAKVYTVADGLAHNSVHRIFRDSRDLLWFCTAEGLSRFDGYNFINYGISEGL